jgi:hypothetical protein
LMNPGSLPMRDHRPMWFASSRDYDVSAARPTMEPARSRPHILSAVLSSCGRPTGPYAGCNASRHIPATGHQLAARAVLYPLPGALRQIRDRVRRPAGTVPPAADQLGRRAVPRLRGLYQRRREDPRPRYSVAFRAPIPTVRANTSDPSAAKCFAPWAGHCTDFPKVLRVFFRHDRRLYGEINKLGYRMIQSFYNAAAGRGGLSTCLFSISPSSVSTSAGAWSHSS